MTDVVLVVTLMVAVAGAYWLTRDIATVPAGTGSRQGAVSVSVIIPARDEEATLPALLASLRHLTVAVTEIVVIDDDSHDATGSVARAGGAVVVPAGDRPAGWTGKAWACHVGARAATGNLLLFLDADTVLASDALDGLIDLHDRHGGLVSVQPFHQVVRPYEQLSSYFNVVSLLASGVFAARPARQPMAFGPCLLTSRADYDRAGGHAAVRGEILDDVQLARRYDRAGLPVRCAVGGRAVRMRSYPGGIRQLAAGWTKNFAAGASAADPSAAVIAVLWLCAHHVVAVGASLSLLEALPGGGLLSHGHPAVWAAAWIGIAWQLRSMLRRTGSFRWWTWALFPLPLLVFDVLFARSAAHTAVRRSVRWRGREVDLRQRGSTEEAV